MIPATTLLEREDLQDRLSRGAVRAIVTDAQYATRFDGLVGARIRIAVGNATPGWINFQDSHASERGLPPGRQTLPDDLLLLYFTSGTTAKPKLVAHTHSSYPVGHLSTMYWIGLRPGDVHLNLSSPGWAKHAWSCVFAPLNAESTVVAYNYERVDAARLLEVLVRHRVTIFCAPPTVWRMLIQQELAGKRGSLRELVSANEPLNPEVIEQVREVWGLTIRAESVSWRCSLGAYRSTARNAVTLVPPSVPIWHPSVRAATARMAWTGCASSTAGRGVS